jgi:hypothetical protein
LSGCPSVTDSEVKRNSCTAIGGQGYLIVANPDTRSSLPSSCV